jgi:hypothetical protein
VQEPRIPVWVAARWPNRRPVRRAARWDGLFPIELPGPEAAAELRAEVDGRAGRRGRAGDAAAPWADAGATWVLTAFGKRPERAAVERAIDAGALEPAGAERRDDAV